MKIMGGQMAAKEIRAGKVDLGRQINETTL